MVGIDWVVSTLATLAACYLGMLGFAVYIIFKNSFEDTRVYVGTEPFPEVELTTVTVQGVAAVMGPLVVLGRAVEVNTLRAAGVA